MDTESSALNPRASVTFSVNVSTVSLTEAGAVKVGAGAAAPLSVVAGPAVCVHW
jgi:hypothetical protein